LKRDTIAIAMAIGLLTVFLLAACGTNNRNASPSGQPPATAAHPGTAASPGAATVDAQAVYKQNCVTCHATDMSGGMGPNLQHVGGRLSTAQIHDRIVNGGGGMNAFKGRLSDAEIQALTEWLSTHR
jgi:cytochrome c551